MSAIRPTTVEVETSLRLVAPDATALPVRASLRYDPADPYAVHVLFHAESPAGEAVSWSFARELLVTGLDEPAGIGDVRVWPWATPRGRLRRAGAVVAGRQRPVRGAAQRARPLPAAHLRRRAARPGDRPPRRRRGGQPAARRSIVEQANQGPTRADTAGPRGSLFCFGRSLSANRIGQTNSESMPNPPDSASIANSGRPYDLCLFSRSSCQDYREASRTPTCIAGGGRLRSARDAHLRPACTAVPRTARTCLGGRGHMRAARRLPSRCRGRRPSDCRTTCSP